MVDASNSLLLQVVARDSNRNSATKCYRLLARIYSVAITWSLVKFKSLSEHLLYSSSSPSSYKAKFLQLYNGTSGVLA